ncbi:hypothetical protein AA313_de0202328 [Arthrobotrys entomopaga]|nr:hypothetical protein AA313_de0202328 [Arthrobotrys entomopaga]
MLPNSSSSSSSPKVFLVPAHPVTPLPAPVFAFVCVSTGGDEISASSSSKVFFFPAHPVTPLPAPVFAFGGAKVMASAILKSSSSSLNVFFFPVQPTIELPAPVLGLCNSSFVISLLLGVNNGFGGNLSSSACFSPSVISVSSTASSVP